MLKLLFIFFLVFTRGHRAISVEALLVAFLVVLRLHTVDTFLTQRLRLTHMRLRKGAILDT